jgi:bifunctional non-homologous end joining protein LigD
MKYYERRVGKHDNTLRQEWAADTAVFVCFVSLATYHKKRQFNRTPEPKGVFKARSKGQLQFIVQKHDASRLHYDFRLEFQGVLKSWAVPKGPSLDPGRKVLAVQVEDHPIDYGEFEGVIPKGQYGGGTVLLWDKGTWQPLHDPAEGFKAGKLHFTLHGKKLQGEWSLIRMHGKAGGDGKNWLLMKLKDKFAKSHGDILADEPQSVKSARSLEQIAGDRDDVWSGAAKKTGHIAGVIKSAWPGRLSPQLAVLAESPPTGNEWLHEIKFDGYRILARIKGGKVQLITRNGKDWTVKFPRVAAALARLKVDSAIVDGEVVVLDKEGRSDFQALQAQLKDKETADPVYFAFDLPFCDGFDLRQTPLIKRKERLKQILLQSNLGQRISFSDHVKGNGDAVVEKACGMALEGIVSKQADAPYVSRRDPTWLKSKCGQRQEFVIIGYTDPQGARSGFGSLLLGYHDSKKRLVFAGRVGTGFNEQLLKTTLRQLRELKQDTPPTDLPPPPRERRSAHWVKPTLVAEVKFTGWTRDGMLRHPAFVAFRSDKPASQIVRELPVKPDKVEAMMTSDRKHSRAPDNVLADVTLTHPDKIFYPDSGTTKRDLAEYYTYVERWMLPHVINRPLALVRCPGGLSSKCFFQRNWSETLPQAIDKADVTYGKSKEIHVAIHNLAGIISMAQIGVLEIHTWNCRTDNVERPDQLIFDLDPGPDLPWKRVVEAAKQLSRTLQSLRLPTFLKTSGGKGVHITIPIEPDIDWDSAKSFCETIAKSLAEESDLFVANMRKDLRRGKVYVDYNRNGRGATAVAPYSTRARASAPVSMPIAWDELGKLKSADHFKVEMARRYLEKRKSDPWRDFEKSRVNLKKIIGRKSAA